MADVAIKEVKTLIRPTKPGEHIDCITAVCKAERTMQKIQSLQNSGMRWDVIATSYNQENGVWTITITQGAIQ